MFTKSINLDHLNERLLSLLNMSLAKTTFTCLQSNYNDASRSYHTLQHVFDCLRHFETLKKRFNDPDVVELAIIFHDFIYDPLASNNEVESARYARLALRCTSKLSQSQIDRMCDLIKMTKAHAHDDSCDAKLFLDIDMSILGTKPKRYQEYVAQVRQEYVVSAQVPQLVFDQRRKAFLQKLLTNINNNGRRLYYTDYFHGRLGLQAEKNIAAELRHLYQKLNPK